MRFNLTQTPRKWQVECLNSWIINNHHGIAKVVTGAGKSLVGMMAIDYLLRIHSGDLMFFVIVPTKVLQMQWMDNFVEKCGVSQKSIQLHGGGATKKFDKHAQIHIMVVNTAARILPAVLRSLNPLVKTFLLCDECHRYGSKINSGIFECKFDFAMGLSATPEREGDFGFEEKIVPGIGPVVYEYGYERALADDIIPKFRLTNIAVDLRKKEREDYEALSELIGQLIFKLCRKYPELNRSRKFFAALEKIQRTRVEAGATRDNMIDDFKLACVSRKTLLNRAQNRLDCLSHIVGRLSNGGKIIIFHELIKELDFISETLDKHEIKHTLYHSEMTEKEKLASMREFRADPRGILLACRALDEGLDVPECGIAIIAAASKGVRQRIQRVGRMLRKTATNNFSWIISIFAAGTTEAERYAEDSERKLFGSAQIDHMTYSANFAI